VQITTKTIILLDSCKLHRRRSLSLLEFHKFLPFGCAKGLAFIKRENEPAHSNKELLVRTL